jgi:hypothetical protein
VGLKELDPFAIWTIEKGDRGPDRAKLYIFWLNGDLA